MDWFNKATEAAAAFGEKAKAGAAAAAKDVKRRTAGVRKVASERTTGFINTVKKQNPNFMVQGQKIMAQGRKRVADAMAPVVSITAILTDQNFNAELQKMREGFLIILQNKYKIANPDIDCLFKGGYVTIKSNYEFNRDIIKHLSGRFGPKNEWEETWKKEITPGSFYTSLGLKSFDELKTKNDLIFDKFWIPLYLHPTESRLRMEVNRAKINNEKIDITKVCQPAAGGASTASRSRRRSSRKNYRKSVRSVKRAARSGSGTRKYRNRS
jgi:hypothetical protein